MILISENGVPLYTDFEWFKSNLNSLYETYGDCYLAIKDKKVIGVYRSYSDGVKNTRKIEREETFIVQRCGRDAKCYTKYINSLCIYYAKRAEMKM